MCERSWRRTRASSNCRFEVPGIQSPKAMSALLKESVKQNIFIHRVTQTKGNDDQRQASRLPWSDVTSLQCHV